MKLGIDFGTCYSSAALLVEDIPTPINAPLTPGYSLPSSIFITEQGEILVGQAAENSRQKKPQRYRREFKRDLGSPDPYNFGDVFMLPEELVTEVLKKLKIEAEKVALGRGVRSLTEVLITVPATYSSYKRGLMQKAGEKAGFSQVQLLEEPVAAAIYYAHHAQIDDGDIILVYDLGGGTFDAALIQKQGDKYQMLAMPKGLADCGGTDFDRSIYQELIGSCSMELRQQIEVKNAWLARAIVGDLCRDLKHQLSEQLDASIYIPIGLGKVETFELTRDKFERMISPLITETLDCCDLLLRSAGKEYGQIDRMLLVGGSSRIPYVRSAIEKRFKISPFLIDKPELAVCLGAAINSITNDLSNGEIIQTQIDLGDTLYQEGKLEEAIAKYQAAISLDANNTVIRRKLELAEKRLQEERSAERQRKNQEEAIRQSILEAQETIRRTIADRQNIPDPESISSSNDNIQAQISLGDTLYQQGKLEAAIAKYKAALQLDANNTVARRKVEMAERSLNEQQTTKTQVKTTAKKTVKGGLMPRFPKQWNMSWKGHNIVVKNWWDLIGNTYSELSIDGNIVDPGENLTGTTRDLLGSISIDGEVHSIRAHIGSINLGFGTGCQIFINDRLVGGDINSKFSS